MERLLLLVFLSISGLCTGTQAPKGNYQAYPPHSSTPPQDQSQLYQHKQYPTSPSPPPPTQQYPPAQTPPGYGQPNYAQAQRGVKFPPQTGFMSRVKNSLTSLVGANEDASQRFSSTAPPPHYRPPIQQIPSSTSPMPPSSPYLTSQPPSQPSNVVPGLLGKLKNIFFDDNESPSSHPPYAYNMPPNFRPPIPGYGPYPPSAPLQQQGQQQQQPPTSQFPNSPYVQQLHHPDTSPYGYDSSAYAQQPQQYQQQLQFGSPSNTNPPDMAAAASSQYQPQQQPFVDMTHVPPMADVSRPTEQTPAQHQSTDPMMLMMNGCVVFIPRPVEFFRKKSDFSNSGPSQLNIFTNFEHVLTKFRLSASKDTNVVGGPAPSENTIGTAELLETSAALLPQAVSQLRAIATQFSGDAEGSMSESDFLEFSLRCQDVIAKEGGLHLSSIAPLTRDLLPRIGLRSGWREALQPLSLYGIPTYIFSSGYGDIIAQAMIQSGGIDGGLIPQNIRIISNFFRTTPDGTVRGFSQPVVHERNKNATTATEHMGMPVPARKHALIFGSHEDDVTMADGTGFDDKIAVGFLELSEDFPLRIQNFLNTYDAVVVGDGDFQFCKELIEDILQVGGLNQRSGRRTAEAPRNVLDKMLMGVTGIDLF